MSQYFPRFLAPGRGKAHVNDLLQGIRRDIRKRMAELEPMIQEVTRLELALADIDNRRAANSSSWNGDESAHLRVFDGKSGAS
jgi:hypothetical protein